MLGSGATPAIVIERERLGAYRFSTTSLRRHRGVAFRHPLSTVTHEPPRSHTPEGLVKMVASFAGGRSVLTPCETVRSFSSSSSSKSLRFPQWMVMKPWSLQGPAPRRGGANRKAQPGGWAGRSLAESSYLAVAPQQVTFAAQQADRAAVELHMDLAHGSQRVPQLLIARNFDVCRRML